MNFALKIRAVAVMFLGLACVGVRANAQAKPDVWVARDVYKRQKYFMLGASVWPPSC